jgi:hypothetical protein
MGLALLCTDLVSPKIIQRKIVTPNVIGEHGNGHKFEPFSANFQQHKILNLFFAGTDLGNKTISDNDNVPLKSDSQKSMSCIPFPHFF